MTNIDHHPPGSFCWIELGTTDQPAAKKFYGTLFGWSATDYPMGPGGVYTMFRLDGRDAAAGYELNPAQRAQHVPPHWMLYILVDSVDASAGKVSQLGGTVILPPFDVMDAGRMAVLQDPVGAFFCLWQPNKNKGIGIAGVHGTLCWADLNTPDPDRAQKFYSSLLGWQFAKGEKDDSGYLHIKNGEEFIGGMPPAKHLPPGAPPHWLAYFMVDDVDVTANKAKEMGARLYLPPMSMEGVGRFSVIADAQGAVFAIFKSARR
jgi:predicted enzyme related to lactoylglutathione lyase